MKQMVFIADLIACSTCFGHHYAHHLVLWFSSCRYSVELRVMCPVCGLLQQPANYFIAYLGLNEIVK
jgi:hypothetical protein